MLQTLNIENVALIDKATLNFDERLNVISGETGAGKSILLDSLSFVFGGRADRGLIRSGQSRMKVEAIFSNLKEIQIKNIANNFGINVDDEIFISRELDINGKNLCKINGELVPVAIVKKLCQMLIDMHGQSEHLSILDNNYQLKIIDMYGKIPEAWFEDLCQEIDLFKENEKEIKMLGGSESEKQNLIDLYSYQIQEIENAKIEENEYDNLQEEKKQMSAFEKINDNLKVAYSASIKNAYSESAVEQINMAKKALQNVESFGEDYKELSDRLNGCLIELSDIGDTIYDKLNTNVFDEERFVYVDNRIDYIKSLFRKYGGSYESLKKYNEEITEKLENLLNSNEKYQKLLENKEKILKNIEKIQNKISLQRKEIAEKLSIEMQKELQILGMPNARINIEFSRINEQFSLTGFDYVEFMFSANLGFELKPLNKVVSGGEMSRVMLAYKILLSSVDEIETIVFDEIDSGLSGNTASVVAEYMARLSINKQILAVSHLPQICAMADKNIKVSKSSNGSQTTSQSVELEGIELIKEITRLMGSLDSDSGMQAGQELKNASENYKKKIFKIWNNLKKIINM